MKVRYAFLILLFLIPFFLGLAVYVPSSYTFFPQKVLAIPIALALIYFGFPFADGTAKAAKNEEDLRQQNWKDQVRLWANRFLVYFVLVNFLSICFFAFNGLVSVGDPIRYQGPVIQKHSSVATLSGQQLSLTLRTSDGGLVRLRVPKEDYDAVGVGDSYCETYQRGWLGVPFKWRKDVMQGFYDCL